MPALSAVPAIRPTARRIRHAAAANASNAAAACGAPVPPCHIAGWLPKGQAVPASPPVAAFVARLHLAPFAVAGRCCFLPMRQCHPPNRCIAPSIGGCLVRCARIRVRFAPRATAAGWTVPDIRVAGGAALAGVARIGGAVPARRGIAALNFAVLRGQPALLGRIVPPAAAPSQVALPARPNGFAAESIAATGARQTAPRRPCPRNALRV